MSRGANIVSAALMVAMLAIPAMATESAVVQPGTDEAAQCLRRLRRAEALDRIDAQAYRGSAEDELGGYYSAKRRKVLAVIRQIEKGRPVRSKEIREALDTSDSWRYDPTYFPGF